MTGMGDKGNLRLARIASESVFREKILPRGRINREVVGVIANQLGIMVEEMRLEWESDASSAELGEAFRLVGRYLDLLGKYRRGSV